MKTITATQARYGLFKLLKNTLTGHQQVRITTKHGAAVLMSEDDFEGLVETLELLSVKGFRESVIEADEEIERGETFSMDDIL